MKKLFVVLLGGEVQGCNIEMHDIRFVVGENIEDCYPRLREEWVGTPDTLHIDAYLVLEYADGHEIEIKKEAPAGDNRLFFVNAGGYDTEVFGELHEIGFFVTASAEAAKKRALEKLLAKKSLCHKDDLYDIDDCLVVSKIGNWHVHLTPTEKTQTIRPDWFGYDTRVRSDLELEV